MSDARYPIGVDGFYQPRRAAFWLFVLFLINGVFAFATEVYGGVQVVPTTVFLALVVWGLYTTVPLWFFHRYLDLFTQHPALGFVLAFAWGGFAATYLARAANSALLSILAKTGGSDFANKWGAAIAGPTTEELLKVLGVILLVLIARTQFRTLLSVVSIGVLVGLGFQVIEDFDYTLSVAVAYPGPDEIAPVYQMLLARGVASGLWSHALFTSITALGVGYFVTRRNKPLSIRLLVAVGCFLLGYGFHFFWNSPLLPAADIFALPLRGLPLLLLGALLWRLAGREEATHLTAIADHYVSDEVITGEERRALASLRLRRHLRRQAKKQHGRKAGRMYRELQHRQLTLVMEFGQYGRTPRTELDELTVRILRDRYNETIGLSTTGPAPAEAVR
ncbi:PrsW family intramembrane metalloprotease [Actinoplanes sp. CA-131856]